MTDDLLAALAGFAGTLLLPGDPGYEHARGVHNGLVDRRPALIARCQGVADVVAAVGFARDRGLEVSVRGGGHDVAGTAVADGALMIDLSRMKGIAVDPTARTARAQGGVTWRELDRETQMHGLAVTGASVSSAGIAGVTLGGGRGWTSGKHGLTVDSLLSAEVVTADGTVVTAGAGEHEGLLWALRGGGGNFGVVCWFEYGLHPVGPIVSGGLLGYPVTVARHVLRFYRDFMAHAPDELGADAALLHAGGRELVAVAVCHLGTPQQADADLAPLLSFGSPATARVGPLPYAAANSMLDAIHPPGLLNHWKSSVLSELSDEAIDTLVARFAHCPSPLSSLVVQHLHGEATRVPVAATACPHRERGFSVVAASVWSDPGATADNVAWTRETLAALAPFLAPRRWAGYLDRDDLGGDAGRLAFGPNYERLVRVKSTYDPTNVFRHTVNVAPVI